MGRRFDPDRAHKVSYKKIAKVRKISKMDTKFYDLNVYITHFIPPQRKTFSWFKSFIQLRLNIEYARSWLRLIKHGTRGNQPWKKDIMTDARAKEYSNRDEYLFEVVKQLNALKVDKIKINIVSNSSDIQSNFKKNTIFYNTKFHIYKNYNKFNTIHNSPWNYKNKKSPWLLTWEHKQIILQDIKHSKSNSLFLYLENDIKFTQNNLEYWLSHKENLSRAKLIPSFSIIEYSKNKNEWVSVSEFRSTPLKFSDLKSININGNIYLNLNNPYCASFLMDLDMVTEYSKSKAFNEIESRTLSSWDIGARAAMGLTFVNVPKNFNSRCVIPVSLQNGYFQLDENAFLQHLPNLYSKVDVIEKKLLPVKKLIINE